MKIKTLIPTLFLSGVLSVQGETTYQVKSGDTLSSIARRHHISLSSLVKSNKISDQSKLAIGTSLKVPGKSSSAPARSSATSHRVQKGDTFYNIARRHGLSVSQLQAANPGVSASRLSIGKTLSLKASAARSTKSVTKKSAPKKSYTARKKSYASAPKTRSTSNRSVSSASKKTYEKKNSSSNIKKTTEKKVATITPAPTVIPKEAPAPPKAVIEQTPPTPPSTVSSIILTEETTFTDFANKNSTSTSQLNALNGWNLPPSTVLARGSEIYVPR